MPARAAISIISCTLATLALSGLSPVSASAAVQFLPCAAEPGFQCGSLGVPLDRAGGAAGAISLSVERKLAGATPSASALVPLAGGPGQPALPFAAFAEKAMASALRSRDLLAFDQRGTGSSDALSCPALESASTASPDSVIARCAEQLGPARGGFTTQESVQDLEALRQASGYQKLVLYGTSYGTKLALEYAERYPQNVEALVLDSVVPTDGPEPFEIPTLQAVGPVVRELCTAGACAGITSDPLGDLVGLIARLRQHPLAGAVFDGRGGRHRLTLDESQLLAILQAGDLNPALRALQPAAIRSALRGDAAPLLRLQALAQGLVPNVPRSHAGGHESGEPDEALFFATTCEETLFPWQRSAPASTRLREALAFLHAEPASAFAPFDAATALETSIVGACDRWPVASPAPPQPAPLPAVPTLVLSGAQDLRTPTSNATRIAAAIPGAQLEVVPFTGHSVVASDLTGCVAKALSAFFAGEAVTPCGTTVHVLAPTPVTPTAVAALHAPARLRGRAGRTLVAVLDTLRDLNRQVIAATLQAEANLPSGASFGGLRGGYARLGSRSVVLHRLAFLPGVQLSGTFTVRNGRLEPASIRVGGANAAAGTVRVGSASKHVTGTLGGRRFDLAVAQVHSARAGAEGIWPSLQSLRARITELRLPAQLP
ncbi:MAG TPA: alpha/beta fold hydrolase [Solirubrobacteraceae bacterium]